MEIAILLYDNGTVETVVPENSKSVYPALAKRLVEIQPQLVEADVDVEEDADVIVDDYCDNANGPQLFFANVQPRRWMLISRDGQAAEYSPAAVEAEAIEPDVENAQVLGVADGDSPNEAWENLTEERPELLEQGWEAISAIPLLGREQGLV